MIISRRKYEQAINEAREEGLRKAEERYYEERRLDRIFDRLNELAKKVSKLEGLHECSCGSTESMPAFEV